MFWTNKGSSSEKVYEATGNVFHTVPNASKHLQWPIWIISFQGRLLLNKINSIQDYLLQKIYFTQFFRVQCNVTLGKVTIPLTDGGRRLLSILDLDLGNNKNFGINNRTSPGMSLSVFLHGQNMNIQDKVWNTRFILLVSSFDGFLKFSFSRKIRDNWKLVVFRSYSLGPLMKYSHISFIQKAGITCGEIY